MPPSRTVAPYSPTRTPHPAPSQSWVTASIRGLSYGIPTRSRRYTAKSARRSKPEDTSQPRRPPANSSTSRSPTPSKAGDRPTTGAQHCFHSKSTSKTDCPDPLTQEVGHPRSARRCRRRTRTRSPSAGCAPSAATASIASSSSDAATSNEFCTSTPTTTTSTGPIEHSNSLPQTAAALPTIATLPRRPTSVATISSAARSTSTDKRRDQFAHPTRRRLPSG
jgi:hypothetical protein